MKYVIKNIPTLDMPEGYYTGERYIVQGCTYYVFSDDLEKAKKYSSIKRVENAIKSLYRWNIIYNLVVEEVEE